MHRNATQSLLSPTQLRVLAELLSGQSVTSASAAADVNRSTVHRWLRTDFDFIAAYNEARNEMRAEAELRIIAASARAADTLIEAISEGNVLAAVALLKGIGLLSGTLIRYNDDADQMRAEAKDKREAADAVRELTSQFMSV
jgi:hypothetical protein